MLTLTQRLGTLDPKAKAATRTAKDGEEYSQLVFEISGVDVSDVEVNSLFASPNAHRSLQAVHAELKGIKAVELDEKIEGAFLSLRTAAVSAANGPEFQFTQCRIDKVQLNAAMQVSFRCTTKPALDGRFGELIARLGHTVMLELRADTPSAQADLPLNTIGGDAPAAEKPKRGRPPGKPANGNGHTPPPAAIGTPDEERAIGHTREQQIAQAIVDDRARVN